ncbi:MAG TPA: hypothetical protein VHF01_09005 [Candidatus Acidoferrum sp.]|nr:hypothetical protein [Candidatus Acidoferrum sp.]
MLGTTKSEGLPLELFAADEPRWLGVQVNLPREVEQPRVLLVSVPYALKAADAETLGGKPLSSFVLATAPSAGGAGASKAPNLVGSTTAVGAAAIGGGGSLNVVAKFDVTGTNVVNSQIFDNGTNVGIGTTSPARSLHIRSAAPTIRLEDSTLPNSFWELQQSAFVTDTFGFLRYENGAAVQGKSFVVSSAGNLGIGTGTPQRKLHIKSAAPVIRLEDSTLPNSFWELQQSAFFVDTFGFLRYESGVAVPSKSFVMSSAGNFGIGVTAPGQKLSVAGMIQSTTGGFKFPDGTVQTTVGGTITAVNTPAGSGLMGGATSGAVNLSLINTCTGGQVLQWSGAAWVCASVSGTGTITGVTAGAGLSGGGTSGNVTLSNTGVLSFNGRPGLVAPTTGDYSFLQISGTAAPAQLPAASLVRAITYLAGCDSCSPLTTADSQNTIFLNLIGSMTINSVTCFSDAGVPTVNIQRNQAGTLTNILSANLTCSTTGATSSTFSTNVLSLNDSLNFIMATADGVAKRVTVIIKATVN